MRVMRIGLEIPGELARVRVQCADGAGVQVIAGTGVAVDNGLRITRAEVVQVQFGVVGAGHPRHAAAVQHGLIVGPGLCLWVAGIWMRVPAPLQGAGVRIVRFNIAGHVEVVARNAYHDVVLDDGGRHAAEIKVGAVDARLTDFAVPLFFAGGDVDRYQVAVFRFEVERVAADSRAAIADCLAALALPVKLPQLHAGARIHRPHVAGYGEVHDAIDLKRRGRNTPPTARGLRYPEAPGQFELPDCRGVDLRQRAVTAAGQVSVIGRPCTVRQVASVGCRGLLSRGRGDVRGIALGSVVRIIGVHRGLCGQRQASSEQE